MRPEDKTKIRGKIFLKNCMMLNLNYLIFKAIYSIPSKGVIK
jgi:hypothetical protein